MAHTLLFSGYGAPGCDDLAVCRLTADGTLETLSTLRHGRAPSFCCRGQNGWIYAASERADGADVTAYVLDGTTLREIARIEIPTGRGLCHLYACGDVIYGSCFENGLYLLAACQREGAVHCYYCSPLPHRAPTETASLALPGASCALVLD